MPLARLLVLLLCLPTVALGGTFLETFDDPDLATWQELVQKDEAPGLWEVADGELEAVSRETFIRLLTIGTTKDEAWEDYTLEFDVKPLKKHGIGGITIAVRVHGTWTIFCNVHDPVVIINDDPPIQKPRAACVAGDLHGHIFAHLHDEPHPLLRLNRWSHLKLEIAGKTLSFWVNGEQVMPPTELVVFRQIAPFHNFPDFERGGVGFGLANYTARFDNIKVTGDSVPNGGSFAVTQVGKLSSVWAALKTF